MYASQAAPVMTTENEEPVCLRAVSIRAAVHDLLAQTRVTQVYENIESDPIETVYTFPLPVDGVLTGVEVKIGDRELLGRAVEKRAAVEEYEERLVQGDSPVMLERLESGLYTLNVGNLLPGERAEITVEFVEVLRVARGAVRYELPTTLGVWYGSPEEMGLEPHQVPEHSLFADNRFSLEVDIFGLLTGAGVSSPSHQVQVAAKGDGLRVSLSRELARMDRDFVLVMQTVSVSPHFAVSAPTEEGYLVLAGFTPELVEPREAVGRSIKIVVDCSGSMCGISMAQAREGVLRILDRLEPEDRFNLILFGTESRQLFPGQVPARGEYLDKAVQTARTMDADMGGTEMASALTRAVRSAGSGGLERDILLLTDGDIYDRKRVLKAVAGTGHRVFPIGVGSAPSHALLTGLARKTGGSSMCVAPDEVMGRKMLEHFKRMRFTPVRGATLEFSDGRPESMLPSVMPGIYSGDMVLVWARFQNRPEGTCTLVLPLEGGEHRLEAEIQDAAEWGELLPRLEAQARIESGLLNEFEAVELAVRYNLVSEYTNYLAVVKRAENEKGSDLPALRKVRHNLPEGFGGIGSFRGVMHECNMMASPVMYCRKRSPRQDAPEELPGGLSGEDFMFDEETFEIPSFLLMEAGEKKEEFWAGIEAAKVVSLMAAYLRNESSAAVSLADLLKWSVPRNVLRTLQEFAREMTENRKEGETALCLALGLVLAGRNDVRCDRNDVRVLRKAAGVHAGIAELEDRIRGAWPEW